MRRLFLAIVLVGIFVQVLQAQTGHYFLSHYKPGNDNISYLSFDIEQDNYGILYFANRGGVLQFDGRTWTMVSMKGAVYSLTANKEGIIYAGGSLGFGKIGLNDKNQLGYLSLSDSVPEAKNIFACYSKDKMIYFLNEEHLFQWDEETAKGKIIFSTDAKQGSLNGLYFIGTQLYLVTENEGLKKVEGGVQPADIPHLQNTHVIFSEQSPDGKSHLIATEDNRLILHKEGVSTVEFIPKDQAYLSSSVIANCAWVTDRIVAIGTLRGGVTFIDVETRETLEVSNYYTGLPDNQVYAVHTDSHKGVWIAHDYGFSRVAPFLPFQTFNHYPGLIGNLLCAQSYGEHVYVGTTLGLFRLSKEQIFENEIYNVTQAIAVNIPVVEDAKQERKKRRGFLGLGIGKKKKDEASIKAAATKIVKKQVQRTRRVLKGIEFAYKRVEGIFGKVDQLVLVGDKLLCGGVGGVFEIEGLKIKPVTQDPARTIFYSKNLRQILVSTFSDEIMSFKSTPTGWQQTEFPDSLSVHADYIFEDNLQDLWICGRDQALRVEIDEGEILDAVRIPLPHTSIDRTVGLSYGNEVYLTQNGEFFHYLSSKNAFVKYDSLPGPKKYFASAGYFWYYDGHKWRTVDRKLQGTMKTEWLALFPDIRYLAPAELGKSLWVITASNELYKFSSDKAEEASEANPLFLKQIRNQQLNLSPNKTLLVDERESALTFEFIQPEYVSFQAVEYRYWVKGLQTDWSEWSTVNNVINFPFLPPGKYDVLVESKDLFGKVTQLEKIDVNVIPPYWKQTWFYGLEFLFFGSLVVLSVRLNVAKSRYRWVSRLLSALTIIMLIQLASTIATSSISLASGPVEDFFLQVGIALLILPVESFLRKRMTE